MGKQKDISKQVLALRPEFWRVRQLVADASSLDAQHQLARIEANEADAAFQRKFDEVLRWGGYDKSQIASVNFEDGRVVLKPSGEPGAKA
jgi:hypothetical protein